MKSLIGRNLFLFALVAILFSTGCFPASDESDASSADLEREARAMVSRFPPTVEAEDAAREEVLRAVVASWDVPRHHRISANHRILTRYQDRLADNGDLEEAKPKTNARRVVEDEVILRVRAPNAIESGDALAVDFLLWNRRAAPIGYAVFGEGIHSVWPSFSVELFDDAGRRAPRADALSPRHAWRDQEFHRFHAASGKPRHSLDAGDVKEWRIDLSEYFALAPGNYTLKVRVPFDQAGKLGNPRPFPSELRVDDLPIRVEAPERLDAKSQAEKPTRPKQILTLHGYFRNFGWEERPTEMAFRAGMTLQDVLKETGGFARIAARLEVIRDGGVVLFVRGRSLFDPGANYNDFELQPNDVLIVREIR